MNDIEKNNLKDKQLVYLLSEEWKMGKTRTFKLIEQLKPELVSNYKLQIFQEKQQIKQQNTITKVNQKKERLVFKNIKKQELIAKRKKDVKDSGQNWGYISKLSEMWNVSHTQVRRFLKEYI